MIKLPDRVDINTLIYDMRDICWEVSGILLHYARILKDGNNKINILKNANNEDPVTIADLKINEIIIKRINEKYKDISWEILSEENVKKSNIKCDTSADWLWVLDPLDGTKDFIQGTRNYAMHLALNHKQKPYLGFVLIPEKDELWISDGEKTWCERKDGNHLKTYCSTGKSLKEMVIVSSKNHRNSVLENLIEKVNFKDKIVMGSIGCKISSIIKGECDIYICLSLPGKSSPKDWDFAAPEAILKAAGGAITTLDNKELLYGKSNFEQGGIIIASKYYFIHEKICFEIKEIIKKYNLYPINP